MPFDFGRLRRPALREEIGGKKLLDSSLRSSLEE